MTIKAYTDLPQSKILAEILPLESADMFWLVLGNAPRVHVLTEPLSNYSQWESYPCWSLAALLDALQYPTLFQRADKKWGCTVWIDTTKPRSISCKDEPVDACVDLVIRLHKQNLL